ncbi:hypothetical protein ACKKBF_B09495 [Auxenochlorella protothecoides x Auxenochlorella symbiontica]
MCVSPSVSVAASGSMTLGSVGACSSHRLCLSPTSPPCESHLRIYQSRITYSSRLCRTKKPSPCTLAALSDGDDILKKYGIDAAVTEVAPSAVPLKPQAPRARVPAQRRKGMGNGVFSLLLLNFGVFAAARLLNAPILAALPLHHWAPQWWQFITATFCHASWDHLSGNAFSLLIFGRIVEDEEGGVGVWATYLLCGLGGCLASYFSAPHTHTVSLGASAAVFGLFAVAVLTKFKPTLRHLLEAVVLGTFVMKQLLNEVHMVSSGRALTLAGVQVGHLAHLAGALVGVVLVLILSRLPSGEEK